MLGGSGSVLGRQSTEVIVQGDSHMVLLHLVLCRWWAIGSEEAQWVLEDNSSSITLADALGLEAVAAYGLLFPALDSTFSTCYGPQSIICIS